MADEKSPEYDEKVIQHSSKSDESDRAETESQIEVLRAAGIGLGENDPTEPVLTLRMWMIGIVFCLVVSGLNTLYTLRTPSITISASVVLLLAYPLGKLWEKVIPDWSVPLGSWSFSLNPGPFNTKEHVLIYIMSNLSVYVRLGADVLTEQQMFYGYRAGWGFQILITLATFLIGFCLAGLFRSIVVVPKDLIWPGVLSVTALTTTLHNVGQDQVQSSFNTWKISRFAFFAIAGTASFCWYWFPDFIFPALSTFSFPCWIAPKNKVVNQLFGMTSGMGLLPITFDLFDNAGKTYSAKKIVNSATGYKLDVQKYLNYSPVYMPIVYGLNMMGLSFATLSALLVWSFLEHRHFMADAARRIVQLLKGSLPGRTSTVQNDETGAKEVPVWWYLIVCAVALFLAIFSVEYWDVELRWYGVLLAIVVALVFYPPLAIVYATSNLKINIDIFCRIVAGFVFPGKVLANIWFFDIGYITTIKGLYFAQDMKLAYYCHIPQRQLFLVQCVGMVMGTLSSVGVLNWSLDNISGVCTSAASNGFSCPYSTTHFNTSLIWGAIGPRRFFSNHIGYSALLYFFIIGAILPIPVYYLSRRYPNSMWKKVHIPLFLGGLNYLPPATGMNYGSWAVIGLTFGWIVRKRAFAWWSKYNFVLSSALDSSVGVAGVLIFLTVFFTGASKHFSWWGTKVYKDTCDYKSCAYLAIPEGGKFGV
ncbi:hypothetical protein N7478_012570 [Penicillium angulare]|uniref:uncharacterized protein n=1 Tax=Penicillium angulare TaxID=116970 RepID=UPI002540D44F|nr:uncharacterized protein N7478_012570 [Penicillium angulare]KAJ5259589.1 hypothetical protein N7478_012570 [Penicillium angulare]